MRESRCWRTHRLTSCEVHVVPGHADLSLAYPNLQEAWVDVQQSRALEALHQLARDTIGDIQQQVRFGCCLDVQAALCHCTRERFAIPGAECQAFCEVVLLKAMLQSKSKRLHFVHRRLWVDRLQPDHLAPKRSQSKGPVEIDLQMTASVRVVKSVR